MATKIALLLLLGVTLTQGLKLVNGKIKISTVTTSACGDTIFFITQPLNEAYTLYKDFLELDFIPWGRTVRNPDGTLMCQFGERDCWANRLQRCVLNGIKDNKESIMHYMKCEFTAPYPSYTMQSDLCARAVGLTLADLHDCVYTSAGDHLDEAAEASAREPMEVINFVPAIVFNDEIDLDLHQQAWRNLKSMICAALLDEPSTGVISCDF